MLFLFLLCMLMFPVFKLPVAVGSHAGCFFKNLGKVGLRRKADGCGNFRNRVVCGFQQLTADLKPLGIEIADWGQPCIFGEGVGQVVLIHVSKGSQRVQGNIVCIVGIQILLNLSAFPCHFGRADGGRNQLLAADNLD